MSPTTCLLGYLVLPDGLHLSVQRGTHVCVWLYFRNYFQNRLDRVSRAFPLPSTLSVLNNQVTAACCQIHPHSSFEVLVLVVWRYRSLTHGVSRFCRFRNLSGSVIGPSRNPCLGRTTQTQKLAQIFCIRSLSRTRTHDPHVGAAAQTTRPLASPPLHHFRTNGPDNR